MRLSTQSRIYLLYFALVHFTPPVLAGTDGWHLDYIHELVNEQLDPIVSPNAQSSHMHKIIGGSHFGASYEFGQYSKAGCSSAVNQADRSNYWMPALYVKESNSSLYKAVAAHPRFYYFLGRNSPVEPVQAFPEGLRMLVGDPNAKAPSRISTFTCQVNSGFTDSVILDNFNFPRDCPYGMKTELFFPPCWDGINLYKSDGSHMSYPVGQLVRDGSCPISHPVRLPHIQLEFTWYTSSVTPGQPLAGKLYWANGDTTGYGVHGDFVNGWDRSVLNAALQSKECGIGGGGAIPMQDCPIHNAHFNFAAAEACKPARGVLQETAGNANLIGIKSLPGCNPPWTSGAKPTCSPAVPKLDISALTGTDGPLTVPAGGEQNIKLPSTAGWHTVYCVSGAKAVQNGTSYTDSKMTTTSCQTSCQKSGYTWAATGQAGLGNWNCVCGSTIDQSTAIRPGMCTTKCPGDATQTCGGDNYVFQVYMAGQGTTLKTSAATDGSKILGCFDRTSNDGILAKTTYTFSSSTMTPHTCIQACKGQVGATWAALAGGDRCYCGSELNIGSGTFVPDSFCSVTCTGDKTETCGDFYRTMVFDISSTSVTSVAPYHPSGWQGCYADTGNRNGLIDNDFSVKLMTPQQCITGCSQMGYKFGAVEAGNECHCGNTFTGSSSTKMPWTECVTKCAGNTTATCGGSWRMDVYATGSTGMQSDPRGYLGCFSDVGTKAFPNGYSYYTNSRMSVDNCRSACAQFDYSHAGVEAGSECVCGKAAPVSKQAPESYCMTKCTANSSDTCGGMGYLEAYTTAGVKPVLVKNSDIPSASSYVGCYDNTKRGLLSASSTDKSLTVDSCRSTCKAKGYKLASMTSSTCQCGNEWVGGVLYPDHMCTSPCPGSSKEICGAFSIVSVYKTDTAVSPVTSVSSASTPAPSGNSDISFPAIEGLKGCFLPGTFLSSAQHTYTSSYMTTSLCRRTCKAKGFTIAGLKGGNTCACSSTVTYASPAPYSSCSTACSGDLKSSCGGSSAAIFDTTGSGALSPSGYPVNYVGCWPDSSSRSLSAKQFADPKMTSSLCLASCSKAGYAIYGTQSGSQCFCGNMPTSGGLVADTNCGMGCAGGGGESCGGSWHNSLYKAAGAKRHLTRKREH